MSTKRARLPSPENAPFDETAYPVAGPTPKKPKKSDPNYGEPEPEKRLKLFKKGTFRLNSLRPSSTDPVSSFTACPKATQERADRVRVQRFFCVDRTRTSETSEEFKILGSTGNQYKVTIDKQPDCSCPDGAKGNTCKHRLFVLLRILQIPLSSNLWCVRPSSPFSSIQHTSYLTVLFFLCLLSTSFHGSLSDLFLLLLPLFLLFAATGIKPPSSRLSFSTSSRTPVPLLALNSTNASRRRTASPLGKKRQKREVRRMEGS
jgi:hypothetical protein